MISQSIRVLIADDHPLVRLGMDAMLRTQPDIHVVGHAVDGEEAVRQAHITRPDVILLDVRMPGKDGLTALLEIKQTLPAAHCVMLTSFDEAQLVLQAVKSGAEGFLLKDISPDELLRAIRAVYAGHGALGPAATRQLIHAYQTFPAAQPAGATMTPSELQVLKLLGRGSSNREIGRELGISIRTVTTHVRHIMDKLGVQNRVQAALYAREYGFTS
jgi:DNA-binding NarL/FixJ family response regulator